MGVSQSLTLDRVQGRGQGEGELGREPVLDLFRDDVAVRHLTELLIFVVQPTTSHHASTSVISLIELEQQGKNSCTGRCHKNSNTAQNRANITRIYDTNTQKQ